MGRTNDKIKWYAGLVLLCAGLTGCGVFADTEQMDAVVTQIEN